MEKNGEVKEFNDVKDQQSVTNENDFVVAVDNEEIAIKPLTPGFLVSRQTPVLFTTDRGLYFRTCGGMVNNSSPLKSIYHKKFCDLEKWIGRSESVGLTPDTMDAISNKNFNKSVRFVTEKIQNFSIGEDDVG